MTSPLAIVYPTATSGVCPAIGLPDSSPEQPTLLLYAGVASTDSDAGPPQDAEQQRIGGVPMWSLGSEPPGHVASIRGETARHEEAGEPRPGETEPMPQAPGGYTSFEDATGLTAAPEESSANACDAVGFSKLENAPHHVGAGRSPWLCAQLPSHLHAEPSGDRMVACRRPRAV